MSQRCALVTGGARGIGRATAFRLASLGHDVAVIDIDEDEARATAKNLSSVGGRAFAVKCDVRVEQEVVNAVHETIERLGHLHSLVNNAGVNAFFDPMAMTLDDWESVFDVDLRAAWLFAKHSLPALIDAAGESGDAAIVNVSSIHATMTIPGMFPYASAKAGLEGLTRSLALEVGPRGVRVNTVAPGFTSTRLVDEWLDTQADPDAARRRVIDLHPARRLAEPDDIANVVAFLSVPESKAIHGSVVRADGGLSVTFAT